MKALLFSLILALSALAFTGSPVSAASGCSAYVAGGIQGKAHCTSGGGSISVRLYCVSYGWSGWQTVVVGGAWAPATGYSTATCGVLGSAWSPTSATYVLAS